MKRISDLDPKVNKQMDTKTRKALDELIRAAFKKYSGRGKVRAIVLR